MKTKVKELRTAAKMTQQQYAGVQNGSGVWRNSGRVVLFKRE